LPVPTISNLHLRCHASEVHSKYLDWSRDVLDLLRAEILESEAQFIEDLIAHDSAYANPAGFSQHFQARRDIDAIAKDVIAINDDVTNIDADTKVQSLIRGNAFVALGHGSLHVNCAAHCIDDAREFQQQAVTGRLDDAAVMLRDLGIDKLPPVGFQCRQRAAVVHAHEARVPGHIE
jgi:hypothetical protein